MQRNIKTKEERVIKDVEIVPNFIVWNWMISGLKLCGVDIMLFAYIYSQSFDNKHYTTASMTTLANWFGLTRQTLVKHIENLPFVEKLVSQEHINGFYTFNYFKVNMDALTMFMIQSDHQVYSDFLDAYEDVLKAGFPKDKDAIHEYFRAFKNWHGGMGDDILNVFQNVIRVGNELRYITKDYDDVPFVEALGTVYEVGKKVEGWTNILNGECVESSDSSEHDNTKTVTDDTTANTSTTAPKTNKIPATTLMNRFGKKPKRTGLVRFANEKKSDLNKASVNEHVEKLKDIVTNFVLTEANNNSELLDLLYSYITAWGNKGITYDSLKASLSLLKDASLNVNDMIMFCRKSIAKNTKILINPSDKQVQQNTAKKSLLRSCEIIVSDYVKDEADNNIELKNIILQYISDILITKNKITVAGQLNQHLATLSNYCKTTESKINSVKRSYMNGWLAMAYEGVDNSSNNSASNTVSGVEVDMEAKEQIIEDNKHKCYLYMHPQVQEALLNYIHNTINGKSMTADKFKINLEFLMLHRFTIDTIVAAVKEATLKNYTYLCLDDYANTKLVLKRYISLERCLEYANRVRKQDCEEAYKKNPNDERFVGMVKFIN